MNQSEIDALVALDPTLRIFDGKLYRMVEKRNMACTNCAIGKDVIGRCRAFTGTTDCSALGNRLGMIGALVRYEPVRD